MMEQLFRVPELHCGACEASVRRALASLPGIGEVQVDLEGKTVRAEHDPALSDAAAIRAAIEKAGFDVEE